MRPTAPPREVPPVRNGHRVAKSRTSPNETAQELFAPLPSRYNRLAAILSFGQDRRWRRTMIDHVAGSRPNLVLDVASGPGAVVRVLTRRTDAYVVGLDLSEEMLSAGADNISRWGLKDRVSLVRGRAERLPFADATFDALTFTYLLRYVQDPAATLRELVRVVKPGGAIASVEFAVPANPFAHLAWWLYTRVGLPGAGYLLGGRPWWTVGRFLGPSIGAHYRAYPLEWTLDAWRRAGVEHVEYRSLSAGGGVVVWGYRNS